MIITSFVGIGYKSAQKFNCRINFLKQYLQFIAYVETKVRYSCENIYELIRGYHAQDNFLLFLTDVKKNVEKYNNFDISFNAAIKNLPKSYGLKKEDIEIIQDFGSNFGKSDVVGQLNFCKLQRDLINASLSLARDEKEKKAKLYFMLWSMSGLSVVLALI